MTAFYTSLNGLRNAETDLAVIANNIANAETAGFKKSSAQFADIVSSGASADPRLTVGLGATVSAINQDFSLGAIEQTGRSLDLAIDGDGFFAIRNAETNETKFTRNGNLQIDGNGSIQDAPGQRIQAFTVDATGTATSTVPVDAVAPVLNAGGFALSSVTISGNGVIRASYSDGSTEPVGRLAIATFAAPDGLRSVGQTNWQATGLSGAPEYGSAEAGNRGAILSGALERSNVDLAEEMVALITAQRNFQANARAIDTSTQITQTIINLRN